MASEAWGVPRPHGRRRRLRGGGADPAAPWLAQEGPETRGRDESGHHGRGGRGGWPGGGAGGPGWLGGFGPWGGPGGFGRFGGPPFGRGGRYGRGPKVRRGDVRAAVLALLAEQPRNGYQIIQEIGERSGGIWRPSPGSVYPALQQLEDEGLIRAEEAEGRKRFRLTEAGQTYVETHHDETQAPWETVGEAVDEGMLALRDQFFQVAGAAFQVVHAGSPAQIEEAKDVLAGTRRALYRILAEGDDTTPGDGAAER